MHRIGSKVDFYITNVCNLTCQHCNRFNNHDFRGWQRWSDYQDVYTQWAKLVELRAVTIMGGEPFLNASLPDWINGINRLFGIEVQVLTNGTRFRSAAAVYETMLFVSHKNGGVQNHIGVSLHNPEEFERLVDDIHAFLGPGVKQLGKHENQWGSDWQFIDSRGVMINVYRSTEFGQSSVLIHIEDGRPVYRLHQSDPMLAHQKCEFARWKSYHFIKGRFYKCGPVALMPEFDQQFSLDITQDERTLLNAYRPLTVDNFQAYHQEFFELVDNPIPQCRFCPITPDRHRISPVRKGSLSGSV